MLGKKIDTPTLAGFVAFKANAILGDGHSKHKSRILCSTRPFNNITWSWDPFVVHTKRRKQYHSLSQNEISGIWKKTDQNGEDGHLYLINYLIKVE